VGAALPELFEARDECDAGIRGIGVTAHLEPPRGLSLLPRKIVGNASFTVLLPSFILNLPINVIGEKP
jgi:hypothetical protein